MSSIKLIKAYLMVTRLAFLISHQLNLINLDTTSIIMNRLLKPDRLDLDPNSPTATKEWKHWFRTVDNFIIECGTDPASDKFRTIINLISHNVFDYVEDCSDYDSVAVTLEGLYIKFPNEIFARHLLAARR